MKSKRTLVVLAVMFALLLASCGGTEDTQEAIETFVSQTQQISELETAAAGGGKGEDSDDSADEADPADSATPEDGDAEPTDTPTMTLTPTRGVAQVSVSSETNCRTGPAASYGYKTTVKVGDTVEVVGVWADGADYVVVDYGGGALCWLWTRYADKKDFSSYDLTSYTTPPTSTPTNTPTLTNTPKPTDEPVPDIDWDDAWDIWVAGAPYAMALDQTGDSISGSFSIGGGDSVIISGSLDDTYQFASGTWEVSDGSDDGTFQWKLRTQNEDQFVGSIANGGTDPWCGARNGAAQPAPCEWP